MENNEAAAEYIRKLLHSKNTEANKLDDIKVSISEAPLRWFLIFILLNQRNHLGIHTYLYCRHYCQYLFQHKCRL